MTQFLQALVNGVSLAGVYALIALGFVIVYKSMQILTFAQPGLLLFGAWWVAYFSTVIGWPFWVALLVAIAIAAVTGLAIERTFLRPMVGKPVFAVAIMTIGIDLLLRNRANDLIGLEIRTFGDPWGLGVFTVGDLTITHRQVAAIVIAGVVIAALLVFFRYSRMGLAMRAAAFDQEVALTQGVSVSAVFAVSWAIAAVLATIGGVFVNRGGLLSSESAVQALNALPVVVIGGLDSIPGALVGALIVAIAQMLAASYAANITDLVGELGRNVQVMVPYLMMFIVLLVRPYGIFGTQEVERV